MKTSSLWGTPPARFYAFLRRLDRAYSTKSRLTLAVLGCADGKFVLPAARRGYRVLAVDVDEIALFGGQKTDSSGAVDAPGLAWRLKMEGLQDLVKIVHGDFIREDTFGTCQAVFTSGAVQYSRNSDVPMDRILESVKRYVESEGFLYIDYMLPFEEKYKGRQNCPGREFWSSHFDSPEWKLLYNRVLAPVLDVPHVENPLPHLHQWGHLLAKRTKGS